SGDRLGQHCLADAGDVLDQDVALGQERRERQPDLRLLALDHFLDVLLDDAEVLRVPLPVERGLSSLQPHLRGSTPDHLTQEYVKDSPRVPAASCPDAGPAMGFAMDRSTMIRPAPCG